VTQALLELSLADASWAIDASPEMVDLAGERLSDRARAWRHDVLNLAPRRARRRGHLDSDAAASTALSSSPTPLA
jgi:hypothetical protein